MNAVDKNNLIIKVLPLVADWMCVQDYFKLSLYLRVPCKKLFDLEKKDGTLLNKKCLKILQYVYYLHGDDFPQLYKLAVADLDYEKAFKCYTDRNATLKHIFEPYRFVHRPMDDETDVMIVLFELCENITPDFHRLVASNMNLSLSDDIKSSLDVFKLFIQGFNKFSIPIFIQKCCQCITESGMNSTFKKIKKLLPISKRISQNFDYY